MAREKKKSRKDIQIKKVVKLTAADLVPDERGPPVRYDWNLDDFEKIKRMAEIGMTNIHIAAIMNCGLSIFDRRIAADKKLWEDGDKNEYNIYAMLQNARAEGANKIVRTIFELATEERHPTMLIWLSKVRLGWREQIDVNADHRHTVVYETQLAGGVIRQETKQIEQGQASENVIDVMIKEVSEEVCPPKESE